MGEPLAPDCDYDVFISYASEDRADFVAPLFDALLQHGVSAWIDYGGLKLGDSVRQTIDDGLLRSRFGVIVLSPHSLEKFWTNLEWDGLLALEDATGTKGEASTAGRRAPGHAHLDEQPRGGTLRSGRAC